MIVFELISALLAPAVEVVVPLFVLFAESLFWVILLIVELILALVLWRRPQMPEMPRFHGVRNKLVSFSVKWRKKREAKKNEQKES
ncbi:hypothetical protein [Shewanella putrefaciens]|uniref:hypothetical protein n=1 Tax=Shewanella putrefaciens TaxID=24 RepID=UPI00356228B2